MLSNICNHPFKTEAQSSGLIKGRYGSWIVSAIVYALISAIVYALTAEWILVNKTCIEHLQQQNVHHMKEL